MDAAALSAVMTEMNEPVWRGRQIADALYRQWIEELSAITTLPATLRARLAEAAWQVGRPRIAQIYRSHDGTERYLVEGQAQNDTVETVWMPEGDDGEAGDGSEDEITPGTPSVPPIHAERAGMTESGAPSFPRLQAERVGVAEPVRRRRATICVSSQVGCAVNCRFCLTAKLGLQRNLTAGEIAGQVISALARHGVAMGRDRVNLVFMGMGEPFLNYDNFMAAVRLLVNEAGLSPQRMTVSTSGIVPGIERFSQEPPEVRPKLAISLNAPNNVVRSEVMPVNRKWPIEAVIDALRGIRLRPRERITFEYVLLGGVTDRLEHAKEVARLVRRTGLPAKVNLIAWNPGPGIEYATPEAEAVENFRQSLTDAGIPAYVRKPRGRDIYAACGQLKRTVKQ
ncbi:MAG TPA: 23S rRNA (adenine(2503)-C(2))-methyltransferase RlmN [Terracidiphilus sp.]|nr:23S rRNA (adenine(2503)-C(2))-methyltransferase RlmN [Terracidiphilus sp.]